MDAADRTAVLAEWGRWHDGYDAGSSRLTRTWVLGMHRLARPLVRAKVPATAVSGCGVVAAVVAARTGGRRAAAGVALTALCDGLDGAVALQRGTASPRGTTVDHACDRATDVLFAVALRRSGARRSAAVAAGVGSLVVEQLRASLRSRPGGAPAVATLGERPVRVVVVTAGLLLGPTAAAATVAVLTAAGAAQLCKAAGQAGR